jgi:Rieske 2Fe-2S family protein
MTPAPVSVAGLDSALLPFGESTMLPAEAYTSDDVLAWERRRFFAASWVCVGRQEAVLPAGRTQVAQQVGDVSLLLARGPAGAVVAFANTCRHRGHELLPDGGTSGKRGSSAPSTRGATTSPAA